MDFLDEVVGKFGTDEAVRRSAQLFRSLVERGPNAMLLHEDGRVLYANRAAAALLNLDGPGRLVGSLLLEWVHPDDGRAFAEQVEQARHWTESPPPRRERAAVPVELHEAFRKILSPGAGIQTLYGATEALPVATIGSGVVLEGTAARSRRGAGTCVGRTAPGIEIRIIQIEDGPIPYWSDELLVEVGKVGEICVRGEVVTRSHEGEPEATAAAKIRDGGTIWHRMGDLGYRDEQGRLWFCGCKGHRVRAAGGDLYTVPLEDEAGERETVHEAIRELARNDERTGVIEEILFHPSFPVDARHNAKIHRLELAEWATGQLR